MLLVTQAGRSFLPLTMALALLSANACSQEAASQETADRTDSNGEATAAGDTRDGKLAFNTSCRTCHSLREGDNRLGPNLHGIVGREAGAAEYQYSPAVSASEVVWDAETLNRFIENPDAVVPGHNMKPYGGISDDDVRANIVAYLVSESDQGGGDTGE
jgi:cytochrome c